MIVLRTASFSGAAATFAAIRARLASCSHRLTVRYRAWVQCAFHSHPAHARTFSYWNTVSPLSSI